MLSKKTKLEDRIGMWLSVLIFTLLGSGLRIFYVLRSDFPLNDGGLFYVMVKDLLANQFRLPSFTSYNHLDIPFAYPPLPFYLAGLLETLFKLDGLAVLRFLPLAISILTIPAFFLLAQTALASIPQALHATLAFAILTPAYEWQIMGGGITRAPGFLFSVLALWQAWQALKTDRRKSMFWTVLFVALSGYCHLEILLSTAIFITVITFFLARNRKGITFLLSVGIGSLVLLAPYILITVYRHGAAIFLSAWRSGNLNPLNSFSRLLFQDVTLEFLFTFFLVVALLAFGRSLQQRQFLLPALVVLTALFDPRSMERSLTIPLCLLVGIGIDEIVLPGIAGITRRLGTGEENARIVLFPSTLAAVLVVFFAVRAAFSSQLYIFTMEPILQGLSQSDRAAMQWVDENLPQESAFLVISRPTFWWTDNTSEWFPALTDRISLANVQGSEWLPAGSFQRQIEFHEELASCAVKDVVCLDLLSSHTGVQFQYIYLSGQLEDSTIGFHFPLPIEVSLRSSSSYRLIYDRDQVMVFEKITGVP
jgi:hypothetical protein